MISCINKILYLKQVKMKTKENTKLHTKQTETVFGLL